MTSVGFSLHMAWFIPLILYKGIVCVLFVRCSFPHQAVNQLYLAGKSDRIIGYDFVLLNPEVVRFKCKKERLSWAESRPGEGKPSVCINPC
jgi:hypothetical protein